MAEDTDQATPLRDAPVAALEDILRSVPRLVERTVNQAGLVRAAAAHLPCLGALFPRRLEPSDPGTVTPEQLGVLDLFATDDETGSAPGTGSVVAAVASDETAPVGAASVATEPVAAKSPATRSTAEVVGSNGSVPLESELAVPDYDSLAASQVVPRLAMLSPEDLRAVLAYEQGHRHRQTILNRVSQLLEA